MLPSPPTPSHRLEDTSHATAAAVCSLVRMASIGLASVCWSCIEMRASSATHMGDTTLPRHCVDRPRTFSVVVSLDVSHSGMVCSIIVRGSCTGPFAEPCAFDNGAVCCTDKIGVSACLFVHPTWLRDAKVYGAGSETFCDDQHHGHTRGLHG
jgi:hypothetical protein